MGQINLVRFVMQVLVKLRNLIARISINIFRDFFCRLFGHILFLEILAARPARFRLVVYYSPLNLDPIVAYYPSNRLVGKIESKGNELIPHWVCNKSFNDVLSKTRRLDGCIFTSLVCTSGVLSKYEATRVLVH